MNKNKQQKLPCSGSFDRTLYLLSGCRLGHTEASAIAGSADPRVRYTVRFFNDLSQFLDYFCDTTSCGDIVELSQPYGRLNAVKTDDARALASASVGRRPVVDPKVPTALVYRVSVYNPVYGVNVRNHIACYAPTVKAG